MTDPNDTTERNLNLSEAELRLGLQIAGIGLARFDRDSDLVLLSPEAAVMYGLPADELTVSVDRFQQTFDPDERAELLEIIDRVLQPESTEWFSHHHRVVWPNGEVRWLSIRKQLFFGGEVDAAPTDNRSGDIPRATHAMFAAIDITERKQIQAALIESEQRFHTLANNISQLAWMAETDGAIFWFNSRWFDYTGTTLAQMQGWGWMQVHHPESVDRVVEHFRNSLTTGREWEDTFLLRGRDGSYRWFLSRAIPIRDATGKILRWFGTNTDVTAFKQAQVTLEQQNQDLDSFVYIVSHDLKAPLRAVGNLSQWIEEDLQGALSTDNQQQMTLLRNQVYRMQATIDGLLAYARIGRTASMIERVEVSALLLEIVESLAPPPTFKIAIEPNLPTLDTNRLLLWQVFTNLIDNGIKHHDRVDGTIQISAIDRGDCYEFAVADDGSGIAPEQHDRIFIIFAAGNPQQRVDSTGIGLAIVKKIVESEGGTIRVESQLQQGTTFYFTWPN